MPRQTKPTDLTLNLKSDHQSQVEPGLDTSPINVDLSSFGGDVGADFNSLPALPQSPPTSPRLQKDSSRNFLTSFKSRVTSPDTEPRAQSRSAKDDEESQSSSISQVYHLRKNPGSTPSLSLVGSAESVPKATEVGSRVASPSQTSAQPSDEDMARMKLRNPLVRDNLRRDSSSKNASDDRNSSIDKPPMTAPITSDWPGAESRLPWNLKGKDKRGKSAERAVASESEDNMSESRIGGLEDEKAKGGFMAGSKIVMNKAKTGGGNLLGRFKLGRSGSHTVDADDAADIKKQQKKDAKKEAKMEKERQKDMAKQKAAEVPDSEYVFKIIHLPLVEQVRITRISKDLNSCRDKTEYWMPSLPWRAIDFLNLNCENEGLYRVPGSTPEIRKWQRRFDQELDVDLLDEQELYDPNTVGSMLKAWIRDLPQEILSYDLQNSLAAQMEKENPEYQKVGQAASQLLRDALSELPPFNYYLLFAVTCHLSLLLSHKDKNRMDLHNLYICVGQSLRVDRWLFNYLVGDWRHCWQGCYTEKEFLEKENAYEKRNANFPSNGDGVNNVTNSTHNLPHDDRAISSSGSHDYNSDLPRAPGSGYSNAGRASPMNQDYRRHQEGSRGHNNDSRASNYR